MAPPTSSRLQIGAQIDHRADGVEDHVERRPQLTEGLLVARRAMWSAPSRSLSSFLLRVCEHGHLGTECVRDLHAHVPGAPESHDGDAGARSDVPVPQR